MNSLKFLSHRVEALESQTQLKASKDPYVQHMEELAKSDYRAFSVLTQLIHNRFFIHEKIYREVALNWGEKDPERPGQKVNLWFEFVNQEDFDLLPMFSIKEKVSMFTSSEKKALEELLDDLMSKEILLICLSQTYKVTTLEVEKRVRTALNDPVL